ncbi:MAG: LacI family DNA-binding transcriptional regulator [Kibdelosporangium sp.]
MKPVSSPRRQQSAADGATIYHVAERAKVSPATVSRVLRGTRSVTPATEQRVRKAIAELRFRPNRLGVALAEQRHAANGIVFPDLSGPFYTEVVLGYEEVAAKLGRSVLILSTRDRADAAQAVLSLADRVDGMVLFGRTVADSVAQDVITAGVPVVLLGRPEIPGADVINTENTRSAFQLTHHLLGHGYRRVVYLGDPDSSEDASGRWSGVSKALREARKRRSIAPCGADEQAGRATAGDLLRDSNPPDALVCFNDEVALGAMLAAEELGLRIGVDVAITGWDDVMAARFTRPALTTVRQPMRELGAQAAAALDERISGARTELVRRVLPTEAVIRASCGGHAE